MISTVFHEVHGFAQIPLFLRNAAAISAGVLGINYERPESFEVIFKLILLPVAERFLLLISHGICRFIEIQPYFIISLFVRSVLVAHLGVFALANSSSNNRNCNPGLKNASHLVLFIEPNRTRGE